MNQKKITQTLIDFEETLTSMLEEMQALKMQVYTLEEQNENLRAMLLAQRHSQKLAFEKLQDIYRDGIHVCPSHFAELRTGDCLFCFDFLQKEGKSTK